MSSEPKTTSNLNGTEPSVNYKAVPVVIFLLFGILFFLGQLYLDRYGGGFNAKVYGPYESWRVVQDLQPKGEGDVLFAKGKAIYATACTGCHQPNGMGAPGVAPPLAGSEWVLAPKPDRLVSIVHAGLTGPITVKGVQWNLQMLAIGAEMSDEDIAAVLTYVRTNKEWGNKAPAVTVEQVKAARDPVRERKTQVTVEELQAIPEQ